MDNKTLNNTIEDKTQKDLIDNKKPDEQLLVLFKPDRIHLVLFVLFILILVIPISFSLFEDYNNYEKIDSQDILKYDFKNENKSTKSTFSRFDLKTSNYKRNFKFKCHYAYKDGEWYIYENDKSKCTKTEVISDINHFINFFKEKDEKKKNIIDSWNN